MFISKCRSSFPKWNKNWHYQHVLFVELQQLNIILVVPLQCVPMLHFNLNFSSRFLEMFDTLLFMLTGAKILLQINLIQIKLHRTRFAIVTHTEIKSGVLTLTNVSQKNILATLPVCGIHVIHSHILHLCPF